jgi:hypothetical protein
VDEPQETVASRVTSGRTCSRDKLDEGGGTQPHRVVAVAIFFDKPTQLVHLRIRINRYKSTRPHYWVVSTRKVAKRTLNRPTQRGGRRADGNDGGEAAEVRGDGRMMKRDGEKSNPLPHATTARASSEGEVFETDGYECGEGPFEEVNTLIHSAIDIDQSILTELENIEEGNLLGSTGEPELGPHAREEIRRVKDKAVRSGEILHRAQRKHKQERVGR